MTRLGRLSLLALLCSCRETVSPERPPYLAILSNFTTQAGVNPVRALRYSVRELSGTLGIDRSIASHPGDTLILSVPPATYLVEMHDLPPTCEIRDGPQKLIALLDSDNTGTLRYNVTCRPSLTIEVLMDGYNLDTEVVYEVKGPGIDKLGLLNLAGPDSISVRADTTVLDGLPGGDYAVSLLHISDNCTFFGPEAARTRVVTIPPAGAGEVTFRMRCSDPAARPKIEFLASTYHDSASGFVFRFSDPDRDLRQYSWDLTDCRGNSLLPDKTARIRRGLDAGRTFRADSGVIVGAFEAGIPDSVMQGGCTAIALEDFRGNMSDRIEQRIAPARGGSAPHATTFNARLVSTTQLTTLLAADDVDGDFAGTFVAVQVRDGVLSPSDGNLDIGIVSPAGFLDTTIPVVPLGSRIQWDDVYSVIVYLIDFQGNFRRMADSDLNR